MGTTETSPEGESPERVRVGALCGSLRDGSYTRKALRVALAGAEEAGAEVELIDLRTFDLPFCDGSEPEDQPGDAVRLCSAVADCHGLILGTPEYHGSFSGVLKNALDLMGFDEFEGKMIGLVGVAGGTMGGLNALNSLRTVGRSLHAWVVPQQVTVPRAWRAFDSDGNPKDEGLEKRLRDVGRQVTRFAYLHGSRQAREFLDAWERAPSNPGG